MESPYDDLETLEFFVKSPAFGALKRVLKGHEDQCQSILATSKDTTEIFQTQGRLCGLRTLYQLGEIIVVQREKKMKEAEQKANSFQSYKQC